MAALPPVDIREEEDRSGRRVAGDARPLTERIAESTAALQRMNEDLKKKCLAAMAKEDAARAGGAPPRPPTAAELERDADWARAVAAGASLGFVALCSRVCENRSPGVAQPGVPYKLVGTYTHEVPDLAAVEAFASGLKSVGK
mmetsp:Transcript_1788/g.5285  ORF Transcript_1788/g.5285 Transcript_1788/m.5285 type:complete len:143 (+) Transcript_1788:834-1262(+)